jgi:hypothetical protein
MPVIDGGVQKAAAVMHEGDRDSVTPVLQQGVFICEPQGVALAIHEQAVVGPVLHVKGVGDRQGSGQCPTVAQAAVARQRQIKAADEGIFIAYRKEFVGRRDGRCSGE